MTTAATVHYDKHCALCRSLAGFAASRAGDGLTFVASETAEKLLVEAQGERLEGERAWAYLLAHHHDLAAFNWLAAKLGLASQAAKAIDRSGSFVKKLCIRCGSKRFK